VKDQYVVLDLWIAASIELIHPDLQATFLPEGRKNQVAFLFSDQKKAKEVAEAFRADSLSIAPKKLKEKVYDLKDRIETFRIERRL